MKRDIDLARQLLLEIEHRGVECSLSVLRPGQGEDVDQRVRYHLRLLIDAGLLKEVDRTKSGVPCVRLTHEGHELIELIRSDVRWREAKWACQERTGGLSLIVIRQVLLAWADDRGGRVAAYRYGRRRRLPMAPALMEGEYVRPRYAAYRPEPYRAPRVADVAGQPWAEPAVRYVPVHDDYRMWDRSTVGVDVDGDGIVDYEVDAVLPDYLI
jgi:hypothetical protein